MVGGSSVDSVVTQCRVCRTNDRVSPALESKHLLVGLCRGGAGYAIHRLRRPSPADRAMDSMSVWATLCNWLWVVLGHGAEKHSSLAFCHCCRGPRAVSKISARERLGKTCQAGRNALLDSWCEIVAPNKGYSFLD
ncbi:hypothetical protein P4O66_010795 [Electrophorus voltai]|uniref:Uncharacterized protein n=1 Tax=Electrophorus voltai TaxID=2609070 RepID=A0AAD8Z8I8_9TELE|nr:hypothetical protein P4O66_010795 [Electrophorus voltai]